MAAMADFAPNFTSNPIYMSYSRRVKSPKQYNYVNYGSNCNVMTCVQCKQCEDSYFE